MTIAALSCCFLNGILCIFIWNLPNGWVQIVLFTKLGTCQSCPWSALTSAYWNGDTFERCMVLSSAITKHKSKQVSLHGNLKYYQKGAFSFLVSFNIYMSTGTQSGKICFLVPNCASWCGKEPELSWKTCSHTCNLVLKWVDKSVEVCSAWLTAYLQSLPYR